MSPELEQMFVCKYPDLFQQAGLGPEESCMAFGIECGNGWAGILLMLCEMLEKEDVHFTQIKEKYGRLTVYTGLAPDWVHRVLIAVERASTQICEVCGSLDDVQPTSGWIRYLCPKCRKKLCDSTKSS